MGFYGILPGPVGSFGVLWGPNGVYERPKLAKTDSKEVISSRIISEDY